MSIFMLPSTKARIAELEADLVAARTQNKGLAEKLESTTAKLTDAESELSIVRTQRNSERLAAERTAGRLDEENRAQASVIDQLNLAIAELSSENLEQRNALSALRRTKAAQARGGDDSDTAATAQARVAAVEETLRRYKETNPVVRAVRNALALPPV